ncbi:MAG: Rhs family protein [Herbinix sp.]|jgi:hypothetical protein|nr:Rhs family protein [Herbinix sp.]
MSDFVLHYDILEGIAKSSNSLGRQADEYANNLTGRIANAIISVTGSSSGYLEDASYYVNQKVAQLQRKAQEFYDFAEQVTILAETATRVDEEVQKLLAENQEEFLSHHESLRIDDWKADILNWLVGIKNKLPFLEVLGNILSAVVTIRESFRDSLKYWFYCEGGKYIFEHVVGVAFAVVAVVLFAFALTSFVAVVAAAGSFVAICGVIGAGIAAVNAVTNMTTSYRAAYTACNGDPTWARIYSKQNTLSQVIRETNFNNGTLNELSYKGAVLIDAVETFCAIVCVAHLFDQGLLKLYQMKSSGSLKEMAIKLGDFKANIKNGLLPKIKKVDDIPVNQVDDYMGGSYSSFADSMTAADRARYIEINETKFFNEFSKRASSSGLESTQISEAYDAIKSGEYTKMASYFDTSSPNNRAVFWSGNKEGAAAYADDIGGIIMEQTPGGKVFDNWRGLQGMYPEWDTGTLLDQKPIWNAMSAQYADGAVGDVTYVHIIRNGEPYYGAVWNDIEKKILVKKMWDGKVSNILEVIIDGK